MTLRGTHGAIGPKGSKGPNGIVPGPKPDALVRKEGEIGEPGKFKNWSMLALL